jgi:polysaccharide biosynthesis protein PslE
MNWQELLPLLWRQRWRMGATFVGLMALAIVITFLLPKTYHSEGEVLARLGRENATLEPTAALGQGSTLVVPQSREDEINSLAEILKSRLLIEKVVDGVGPAALLDCTTSDKDDPLAVSGPRQRAIRMVAKQLRIEPVKKSDVINVTYEGQSPRVAQDVVAKAMDAFIDEYIRLNRAPHAHEFLEHQTTDLHASLGALEEKLRRLKDDTGISDSDGQRRILIEQIGRLEDELIGATTARKAAAAQLAALRTSLASVPRNQVAQEVSGIGNEGTDLMRQQFFTLQIREKEARAKYMATHPKVQEIAHEVDEARRVLEGQQGTRSHVMTGPNKAYEETQIALLRQQELLANLDAKIDATTAQLADRRTRLKDANGYELAIARLRREIDIQDENYRKYRATMEQSRIDKALSDEKLSSLRILQPATYDPKAVAPDKLRCLAFGLLLALSASAAVAFAAQRREEQRHAPRGAAAGSNGNGADPLASAVPRRQTAAAVTSGN